MCHVLEHGVVHVGVLLVNGHLERWLRHAEAVSDIRLELDPIGLLGSHHAEPTEINDESAIYLFGHGAVVEGITVDLAVPRTALAHRDPNLWLGRAYWDGNRVVRVGDSVVIHSGLVFILFDEFLHYFLWRRICQCQRRIPGIAA